MIGVPARARQGLVAAIVALVIAIYAQTLAFPFHFDDYALMADPFLTASDGWWRVFRFEQTRPVTYLTFWINHRLGGAEPWGYHAVNIALQLAAVLAAAVALQATLPAAAALIAVAVFALHPLPTEPVSYVFARAGVLASLFCLLAWIQWMRGRGWLAAFWFALAVLSKEECVSFPVFLMLIEWSRGRWKRSAWLPWSAMAAVAFAAGVRVLYVAAQMPGTGLGKSSGMSPLTYALTQPKVIWKYVLLFLCPLGQTFDHQVAPFSMRDLVWIAALLGLVALAIWKVRAGGAWILGALILLAPSSSFVPLADLMFEHRMYLPLVSLSAATGWALERLRWPVPVAVTLVLAGLSWVRAGVWRSEESLWSDAVAKSPNKARPKLQLARDIAVRDPQRATALLLEARRLEPANPETFTQMGVLQLDQGNPSAALLEFEDALRLNPTSPDSHSNRGTALFLLGGAGEAEAEFAEALEIAPCHFDARHNLLILYHALGQAERRQQASVPPQHCRFTPQQLEQLKPR